MEKRYLLGIDLGTSACKIAAYSIEEQKITTVTREYPTYYPGAGWVEQDPRDWWQAVCRGIRELLEQNAMDPGSIAGIGADSQSWAPVFMDEMGQVLARAPIWLDTRSHEICRGMDPEIREEIFRVSGNPFEPMYITPKVLWMKENRPEVYKAARWILQANGYLVYRLTGRILQDLSQTYGWHCFWMRRGCWNYRLAEKLGIRPELLPEINACHEIIGSVSAEAAEAAGLVPGIPVIAGGVDAACAAFGAGLVRSGQCQEQGGQAGGISICTETYQADPGLILSFHVVPGYWLLQGGTTGGGGILRWIKRELGQWEQLQEREGGESAYELLTRFAEKVPPGSEGVTFLPYMSGERTPIWNARAKGVFYGLDYSKTKGHLVRAAMEGVGYSLRHNIEVAEKAGCKVGELRATGGSANSLFWTQMKADITGKRFLVPSEDISTVLGTIMLTGVGTGVFKGFEAAAEQLVHIKRSHEPREETFAVYRRGYEIYRRLYEELKALMV